MLEVLGGGDNYLTRRALNHVAIVVDDPEAVEARVVAAGLKPHSHQTYEPRQRSYFHDRGSGTAVVFP